MTTTAAERGDHEVCVGRVQGGGRAVVFAGDLPGRRGVRLTMNEDTATGTLSFLSGTAGVSVLSPATGESLMPLADALTAPARAEGEGTYTVIQYGLFPDPESRLHALPLSQGPELAPQAQWSTVQSGRALIREAREQCAALGFGGTLVIYGRADDGYPTPIGKLTSNAAGHWQTALPDA